MPWVDTWGQWLAWPFKQRIRLPGGTVHLDSSKPTKAHLRELAEAEYREWEQYLKDIHIEAQRRDRARDPFRKATGAVTSETVDRVYGDEIPPTLRMPEVEPDPPRDDGRHHPRIEIG